MAELVMTMAYEGDVFEYRHYPSSFNHSSIRDRGTVLKVTSGTGFLGAHLISQLPEKGHTVCATARSTAKLPQATTAQLEILEVPTLTSDHTAASKGAEALIHFASPVFGEGIVRSLERHRRSSQASIAAGAKKVIVSGTFPISKLPSVLALSQRKTSVPSLRMLSIQKGRDAGLPPKPLDKAIWDISRCHPDVDVTVLLPPAIFGPQLSLLTFFPSSLSTNGFVKMLIVPESSIPIGHMIVRDAARAHVLALLTPPVPGRDKRFNIGNGTFKWKDVAELISRKKPEFAGRLPKESSLPGPD
ncbi:hypothetical protein EV368DRAFT_87595 [Lentinula lateritia]|uniref:Uncharacterized protein n=1 Tax=Lentinula aff. lateritia TaxID=2804960 RepID=A0ACC1TJ50_9AGAR|nr:hypothetical protein F5876DRAFT_82636 [Lentinula aff. lateritia]KAJ3847572.1 hypothetical protein EV368DRAFT_87595 [Lentinula lateritia]